MKKFLSILLAAMMLLATAGVAFADDYTITAPDNGHTYEILQIFTGDYSSVTDSNGNTSTALSNAKWGKNGTGAFGTLVAESVLDDLKAVSGSSDDLKRAEILKSVNLTSEVFATITPETENLKVSVPAGYYLIRDKADSLTGDMTATLYIVEVADSITISPKSKTVEFKKQIQDKNDSAVASSQDPKNPSDWQDSADYDIGDHVPFKLTFNLPDDYDAYSTYYVSFNDTMENTLEFDGQGTVKVMVDGVVNSNWTIETNCETGETFKVIMDNVKEDAPAAKAGSTITVEYTATLKSNANLGEKGNMNKANASFSNNPYSDSKGTTPDDAVICFTYTFEVTKTDKDGNQLPGAEFILEKFNAAEDAWTTIDVAKNEAGTIFTFKGLDDGTYRLTETVTPVGYNTCSPMTFDVVASHVTEVATLKSFDDNGGRNDVLESLSGNKATGSLGEITITHDAEKDALTTTVKNYSGAQLPETGGIGTTLFYLFGSIMAAGSALILVVRRRAEAEEE